MNAKRNLDCEDCPTCWVCGICKKHFDTEEEANLCCFIYKVQVSSDGAFGLTKEN